MLQSAILSWHLVLLKSSGLSPNRAACGCKESAPSYQLLELDMCPLTKAALAPGAGLCLQHIALQVLTAAELFLFRSWLFLHSLQLSAQHQP